ncbi:TrkH family potassium uptake protein [Acidobacteriota bacterium]
MGDYQSPFIEWVIIFFMLAAGINFSLYFHLFFRRGASRMLKDHELRYYLAILVVAALLITGILMYWQTEPDASVAFRKAVFQATSILTTTGYGTADFNHWPDCAKAILLLLMFIGGCAGSTGGSMKVIRVIIVGKWLLNEIHHAFKPKEIRPLRVGGAVVPDHVRDAILGFVLLFVGIFAAGTLLMTFLGCDLVTGFSSVIATLGNVGPGLGSVGPAGNYTEIPMLGKLLLSFFMLLGRLELYTVLVLFSPSFWKR